MKRFSPLRVRLAGQETRNRNCHHCFKSRSLWEYFSKHGGIVPMNRFYHKLVWTAAQKHQGSLFLIETNMYESHVAISHVPRSWLLPLYWKIIFLYEQTAYTILYMCVWREGGVVFQMASPLMSTSPSHTLIILWSDLKLNFIIVETSITITFCIKDSLRMQFWTWDPHCLFLFFWAIGSSSHVSCTFFFFGTTCDVAS